MCGTAVSDATFIESLETRRTVAGRLVADVRASAPPLGPQQSQPAAVSAFYATQKCEGSAPTYVCFPFLMLSRSSLPNCYDGLA